MTLVIKELIIKGVVTKNPSNHADDPIDKKEVLKYLDQMKKELKKDCVEAVLSKLESNRTR
jgi:hypothetical protein